MGRKKNKKPPMTADKKKSSYEVTTAKLLLATAIVEILEKLLLEGVNILYLYFFQKIVYNGVDYSDLKLYRNR